MTKQPVVCDVECYINYALIGFKSVANGTTMTFERHEDSDTYIDTPLLLRVLRNFTIVTFNGRSYDMPMIVAALNGATNTQLKALSDRIVRENIRWWDVERELGISVPQAWDHIDLSEPAPGVAIPLKLYGARMHSKRLQDLPVEPDAVLTPEQIATLRDYNVNSDLPMTVDLWNAIRPDIELREHMSAEYGIDLRSKSDAQIAEAVIKKRVTEMRGGRRVERAEFDEDWKFEYEPPSFVQPRSQVLRDTLDKICALTFELNRKSGQPAMPKELASMIIKIGEGRYKMGMGGLHSMEKSQGLRSDEHYQLEDDDVASFYPKLILVCKLYPPNMGLDFARVYAGILDRRLEAKKRGLKRVADSYKITLNGSYGKMGSPYSIFYAPALMLQVTLTGQMILLMLIEMLEDAGIRVVSANTDGVISMVPRHMSDTKAAVLKAWQEITGFDTENTKYDFVFSRDVNSYIAAKTGVPKDAKYSDRFKTKGEFATTGLMKNPSNQVCVDAVVAYLTHGTPIRQTIESCTDIRKFINAQRVTGGAVWQGQHLGRVVRSYKSIFAVSKITYGAGKKEGHKVPDSDPVQPLMVLPDEFPNDVDYDYYVDVAEQMLVDIGAVKNEDQDELWGNV